MNGTHPTANNSGVGQVGAGTRVIIHGTPASVALISASHQLCKQPREMGQAVCLEGTASGECRASRAHAACLQVSQIGNIPRQERLQLIEIRGRRLSAEMPIEEVLHRSLSQRGPGVTMRCVRLIAREVRLLSALTARSHFHKAIRDADEESRRLGDDLGDTIFAPGIVTRMGGNRFAGSVARHAR